MAENVQNKVSAGTASDVRTLIVAALLTYSSGMLAFVGYVMLNGNGGGVFLGLIAAFFAVLCWRSTQGRKIFPRDVSTKSVVILALFAAVVTLVGVSLPS